MQQNLWPDLLAPNSVTIRWNRKHWYMMLNPYISIFMFWVLVINQRIYMISWSTIQSGVELPHPLLVSYNLPNAWAIQVNNLCAYSPYISGHLYGFQRKSEWATETGLLIPLLLYVALLGWGKGYMYWGFGVDCFKILVSIATKSSHRLIMKKMMSAW